MGIEYLLYEDVEYRGKAILVTARPEQTTPPILPNGNHYCFPIFVQHMLFNIFVNQYSHILQSLTGG